MDISKLRSNFGFWRRRTCRHINFICIWVFCSSSRNDFTWKRHIFRYSFWSGNLKFWQFRTARRSWELSCWQLYQYWITQFNGNKSFRRFCHSISTSRSSSSAFKRKFANFYRDNSIGTRWANFNCRRLQSF